MVNVLIADDNIDYAINLMNYINKQNPCQTQKITGSRAFAEEISPLKCP